MALHEVARYFPTAIISGRGRDKVLFIMINGHSFSVVTQAVCICTSLICTKKNMYLSDFVSLVGI